MGTTSVIRRRMTELDRQILVQECVNVALGVGFVIGLGLMGLGWFSQ